MSLALIGWAFYLTVCVVGMVRGKSPHRAALLTGSVKKWKADARLYVRECIGALPDRWQDEALRLVSDPKTRRLAFKACKGPGKTTVLAWIILWFLTCHPESKVGCTSITEANIDANLWPEIYKWLARSPFLAQMFTWSRTRVARKGTAGANWFAEKRTWPKSGDGQQQADALAGLHADDIMFVLDESGGIPQGVMVAAEAVLSTFTDAMEAAGHRAIVVQSGNPTHVTGPLHRACTIERTLWTIIQITGDPDNPDRSPRIDLKWAREQIALWGRDNPWVKVNVLGEFPDASINALLGIEEVEKAMKRHYRPDQFEFAQKRLGVDVARFGDDRTVLFPRQGLVAGIPDIIRQQRTTFIAGRVARAYQIYKPELIMVDDTGHWGHGVIDQLIASGIPCLPINYAEPSSDKRYKTTRDLIWFNLATWVKAGGALPNIPALVPELTEPTYTFIGGKFVLEDKDQIKKRLGYSPDLADALAQTFVLPELPGEMMQALGSASRNQTTFNPFEQKQGELEAEIGRVIHDWDPFK